MLWWAMLAGAAVITALVLALECGLYAATAGPWASVLLHILPITTLYPVQIRIRSTSRGPSRSAWRPTACW